MIRRVPIRPAPQSSPVASAPTRDDHHDAQGCETCPTCRRYTLKGQRQRAENYRQRPIYGTDFTKPTGEIIEDVRRVLARARGTLHDIGFADPFWKERLAHVEGLLTCGLVALYNEIREAPDAANRSLLPRPTETDSDAPLSAPSAQQRTVSEADR